MGKESTDYGLHKQLLSRSYKVQAVTVRGCIISLIFCITNLTLKLEGKNGAGCFLMKSFRSSKAVVFKVGARDPWGSHQGVLRGSSANCRKDKKCK